MILINMPVKKFVKKVAAKAKEHAPKVAKAKTKKERMAAQKGFAK